MKNTIKFALLNLTSVSALSLFVPWSGGRGWLNVVGTFVGASAELVLQTYSNGEGGIASMVALQVPGIPAPITAPGVYPFEAPEGFLAIGASVTGVGDSIALTELEIIDVNR